MTMTVSDKTGKIDIPSRSPSPEGAQAELAGSTCTGARARPSAYPSRWGRGARQALMVTVGDYRQVWEATPLPLGEVWGWVRAGGWTGQKWPLLRGVYAIYGAVVAAPVTAVAYWAADVVMQVSGLDDPEDPQVTGWTPATPLPLAELWWRRASDMEAAEQRRRLVGAVEGAAIAGIAAGLGVAWICQRIGRFGVAAVIAAACWWGLR